jgi:hypothetical protein
VKSILSQPASSSAVADAEVRQLRATGKRIAADFCVSMSEPPVKIKREVLVVYEQLAIFALSRRLQPIW